MWGSLSAFFLPLSASLARQNFDPSSHQQHGKFKLEFLLFFINSHHRRSALIKMKVRETCEVLSLSMLLTNRLSADSSAQSQRAGASASRASNNQDATKPSSRTASLRESQRIVRSSPHSSTPVARKVKPNIGVCLARERLMRSNCRFQALHPQRSLRAWQRANQPTESACSRSHSLASSAEAM